MRSEAIVALAAVMFLNACEGCDASPLSVVPEPGAIVGRICDPADARGIFGARVWVTQVFGDGSERDLETVTDGEGAFVLEGVPEGTYELHVSRGSFRATVKSVEVLEAETTVLDESACIEPEVSFTVYEGHDSVEDVLTRIGYAVANLIDTKHEFDAHDETTPSWLVEEFGEYEDFADNDILFINCAGHEWALDNASPGEVTELLENLRRFVSEGGSIYLSDWSYDLLELLYPDAADWFGDDEERDAAQKGKAQVFVGDVVDPDIIAMLGRERASLKYDQSRIAIPVELGVDSRAMITADIVVSADGGDETLQGIPVLFEHRPPGAAGRVIFTTFHNGSDNTEAMDEVLRAIVYSL